MPAPPSTSPAARQDHRQRLDSRLEPRRADRGAQLHRAAGHGDDPDRRPRGRQRRRAAVQASATRSRSGSARRATASGPRRLQGRDRRARAGVHERAATASRARLRRVAPPAPQPAAARTFQDMTPTDIVQKVASASGLSRARSTRPAPSTSSCSRAWRPTWTSCAGSRAMDDCEFGDRRRQGVPAQAPQRRRRDAGARLARERCSRSSRAMSAVQQHDTVTVVALRPGEQGGRRRRGDHAAVRSRAPRSRRATRPQDVRRRRAARRRPRRRRPGRGDRRSRRARSTSSRAARSRPRASMEGNPRVKAGGKIKLEGFGGRFDGELLRHARSRTSTATATSARASRSPAATRARSPT